MGQDVECAYLCEQTINGHDIQWTQQLIEHGYMTEWILDNLPGATSFMTVDRQRKYYAAGFRVGYKDYDMVTGKPAYYINNHFTLVVRWRKAPGSVGENGGKVVIGFEVFTKSVAKNPRNETSCPNDVHETAIDALPLYIAPNSTSLAEQYPDSSYVPEAKVDLDQVSLSIPYSYSVYFREEKEIEWANRWDLYFNDQSENTSTHWLAIVNSVIISSLLGAVCMVIWIRTTGGDSRGIGDGILEEAKLRPRRRTEKKTNGLLEKEGETFDDDLTDDEMTEDVSGWKLLHADVFRSPSYAGLLAPMIGSGFQLVCMISSVLLLSCFGVLNPSWRGGFVTVGVLTFFFSAGFSGYLSARLYRTLGGQDCRKNMFMTALLFPGLLFSLILFLNLFTWAQASSTAIPFTTLVVLALLWLAIQLPLVNLGSHYGYHKSKPFTHPTRTSAIPRQIPTDNTTWYSRHRLLVTLLTGLVPFAVLFIELLFVFRSVYLDKSSYYYVFGFLSIVTLLLAITIAETVIICLYVQLCAENYHWWWTSFLTGGSSAVWVFVYMVWYYWTKLHIDGFVSSLLFFSYGILACSVYGLATGTIGFLAGYFFVTRIYRGVKVD